MKTAFIAMTPFIAKISLWLADNGQKLSVHLSFATSLYLSSQCTQALIIHFDNIIDNDAICFMNIQHNNNTNNKTRTGNIEKCRQQIHNQGKIQTNKTNPLDVQKMQDTVVGRLLSFQPF